MNKEHRNELVFRFPPELRSAVESWAEKQPDLPDFADAVCLLLEIGLTSQSVPRKKTTRATNRAREMAESAVDKMLELDVTPDDRETRKQQLVGGPSIFRDIRKDRTR